MKIQLINVSNKNTICALCLKNNNKCKPIRKNTLKEEIVKKIRPSYNRHLVHYETGICTSCNVEAQEYAQGKPVSEKVEKLWKTSLKDSSVLQDCEDFVVQFGLWQEAELEEF